MVNDVDVTHLPSESLRGVSHSNGMSNSSAMSNEVHSGLSNGLSNSEWK